MKLGIGRKKKFMEKPPYGIKCERVRQRIAGSMLAGDSAAGGLPGNPWPSLAEFYRLSARVRRQLGHVRAPCLVVHSANDDVASVRNARIVERRVTAEVETMLLHDSYHMVTVDQEHREVVARSADFFSRCADGRLQTA
jgi:carboxylesterase